MQRSDRTGVMLGTAMLFAGRSTCMRKQVGAVLAIDNRIISIGYNGAPSGMEHCNPEICNENQPCERTVHAEMNTIAFAAKHGISTEGSVMYVTLEPCLNCSKAMINAGIKKLYYVESYRDHAGIDLLIAAGVKVYQMEVEATLYEE